MEFLRRKKEKGKARKCFFENGSKFLQHLIADCNGISIPIRMFSSYQICQATNHFDSKRFLYSMDAYFSWYKGVIEGRPYAIKKFGDTRSLLLERAFYNDIVLSVRVSNHSGFLKLVGCCLEFPFPVMAFECLEYVALNNRGSVGSNDGPLLPWNVRLRIAKEVAIAVTYLHTAFHRIIIHRDIKPGNVFLDKNYNAKLSDFSWSLTLPEGKTWIRDQLAGTIGYIDPIYISTAIVTEYSDVFSFGILMLVLLIGRSAYDDNLLEYVTGLRERGEPVEFGGDSKDMRHGQMNKFLELALRCCAEKNEDRPKMINVAKEIKLIERSLDP